jgi:DNA mismatch repair protein MLH1
MARESLTRIATDRLVECSPLRKSLEITYLSILPKGSFPFIYISLEISPDRVDPNVHPNKKEVHFLDQDEIVERICDKLNVFLAGSNSSRSYSVQVCHKFYFQRVLERLTETNFFCIQKTILPMATPDDKMPSSSRADPSQSKSSKSAKVLPQKLVRTDHRSRTLQSMLRRATGTSGDDMTPRETNSEDPLDLQTPVLSSNSSSQAPQSTIHPVKVEESRCLLASIRDLKQEIKSKTDNGLQSSMFNLDHHDFPT